MKFIHDLLFPVHASQLARQQALTELYCKRLNRRKAERQKMLLDMKKLQTQMKELTKAHNKEHNKQHNLILKYERKLETLYDKVDTRRRCGPKSKQQPTYLPEKIVDMRNNKYCVKWQDYKEHSWEHSTADVIRLNPHLVQAYKSSRSK